MRQTMVAAVLGFFAIGLSACGSSNSNLTPQEACNERIAAECQKVSDCLGATGLTSLGGYTSVADCTTQMQAQDCTAAMVACTAPETYSVSDAQACIDAVKALTCATLVSVASPSDATPPVCSIVCGAE